MIPLTFLCVLGLARTGLIFTRLQEGAQPGGGGWPHLAKQSLVFHTMWRHAGFRWGERRGGNSLVAREHAAPVLFGRAALWVVRFVVVFSPYLYHCCYCFPLFSVLLNCPYPDPPVSACFFFHSPLHRSGGRGSQNLNRLEIKHSGKPINSNYRI